MSDINNPSENTFVSTGAAESQLLSEADATADSPAPETAGDEGETIITFSDLSLSEAVLKGLEKLGFESPTPIQRQAIPVLLEGHDVLGQAQTGTGKTAAFALPILSTLSAEAEGPQALILEPTRELAIQVAEAFVSFASAIDNFRVAPIYGGASYESQLRSLRHGAQVVVATPGRLIDLIEHGQLDLNAVRYVVIDEGDEMLNMGFIDDVDWILGHTPEGRQSALFSATLPPAVRRIVTSHLREPVEVRIESRTTTATTVHQRYWVVSGAHKLDAMTRMLEIEKYDAVLVFVRTKTAAEEVSTRLMARGFACDALHGDVPQRQREKIIGRLKAGQIDILVATDVAARGLDVERITHVFNYDIPYDAESYVHRIGRTGRAGRTGEAILFVAPRERRALKMIERITGQKIEPMAMPSVADVNRVRIENFKTAVLDTIAEGDLEIYTEVVSELLADEELEPEVLCAALARMAQKGGSLLLDPKATDPKEMDFESDERRGGRREEGRRRRPILSDTPRPPKDFPDLEMVRYRLAVGHRDGVKPGQIVGAIANEGELESKYMGDIAIFDSYSTIDLPAGMPSETLHILERARVCGRPLEIREYTMDPPPSDRRAPREGKFRGKGRPDLSFGERSRERRDDRSRAPRGSFRRNGRREG